MSAADVREAIENMTKLLSEQPQRGGPGTLRLQPHSKAAYGFESSAREEKLL
jgi:hypothetical protein